MHRIWVIVVDVHLASSTKNWLNPNNEAARHPAEDSIGPVCATLPFDFETTPNKENQLHIV